MPEEHFSLSQVDQDAISSMVAHDKALKSYENIKFEACTQKQQEHLGKIKASFSGESSEQTKTLRSLLSYDESILDTCVGVFDRSSGNKDIQVWIIAVVYDLLRSDASVYTLLEKRAKEHQGYFRSLQAYVMDIQNQGYVADKALWLLTAFMANIPHQFDTSDVTSVLAVLESKSFTDLAKLEAITNLLKCDAYRALLLKTPGAASIVWSCPRDAPPAKQYRWVFGMWMLSFDKELISEDQLRGEHGVIGNLRAILATCRTEKVIRLSLTLLKNLMTVKSSCNEVVDQGFLEVVQQLEYEKWRDAELYDAIREVSMQLANEVSERSNFDRYEQELRTKKLKWGFIHSAKFWYDNKDNFAANDFSALRQLATVLQTSEDTETLAVACHDIGEFVSLHPMGKKKVSDLGVKERVMTLMGKENREVRREALLCCQKIMLNKWQDVAAK